MVHQHHKNWKCIQSKHNSSTNRAGRHWNRIIPPMSLWSRNKRKEIAPWLMMKSLSRKECGRSFKALKHLSSFKYCPSADLSLSTTSMSTLHPFPAGLVLTPFMMTINFSASQHKSKPSNFFKNHLSIHQISNSIVWIMRSWKD